MKKITQIIFISSLLAVVLWSCKKDEDVVSYKGGTNPVLTVDDSIITLNSNTPNSEAIKLSWTNPNYVLSNGPSSLNVNYTVDIDTVGSNFSNANTGVTTVTNDLSTVFTQRVLDSLIINRLKLNYGKPYNLIIRVQASLGTSAAVLNSNTLTFDSVTAYRIVKTYPSLYLPGDYQGWNPGGAINIASTNVNAQGASIDNNYEGYVYVPTTAPSLQFKITSATDWNHTNYGSDAVTPSALSTDASAGNLLFAPAPATPATAGGYYRIDANPVNLTWSDELVTWALIDNSTSIPLTFDPATNHWVATSVDLTAGDALDFRANDATDAIHNLGVDNSGDLVNGGATIPVTATGNYTVTLDLSIAGNYSYTLQKN